MGKLTENQVQELLKSNVLTEKTVGEMQEKGLVSTTSRTNKRYLKTASGSWVSPQLYFQGLKGNKYSKEMTELKNKFNDLANKYTTDNKGT
tara:strand:+ start:1948 stop:2220 length:273 start_codon:yes stop_codon:yes gene_type:complete